MGHFLGVFSIYFIAIYYILTDLVSTSEDVTVYRGNVNGETLTCGEGEYDSVYWYWNGELLPSDGTTHNLTGHSEEVVGVYQCFKNTTDGSLYLYTWRVFETCKSLVLYVMMVYLYNI